MAVYSKSEVKDILLKLSQQPASEVKFIKFERLGIAVNAEEAAITTEFKDDGLLYICSVCTKRLNSAHLLDLHVTENHDSYFDVQKEKQPMFSCYLEECKHKSSSAEDRKDHCIKIHKFPHDFRFDNVSIKKKSTISSELMDTSETANPSSSSSKPKITNFHFGHKSQKTFKSGHKTNPIESMAMDLKESLPEV